MQGYNATAAKLKAAADTSSHDGPFDWTDFEQGIVLGSYFYGYFVTQVRHDSPRQINKDIFTCGEAVRSYSCVNCCCCWGGCCCGGGAVCMSPSTIPYLATINSLQGGIHQKMAVSQ